MSVLSANNSFIIDIMKKLFALIVLQFAHNALTFTYTECKQSLRNTLAIRTQCNKSRVKQARLPPTYDYLKMRIDGRKMRNDRKKIRF